MEMDIIKWDEGMAVRCIARHNAYHLQLSRSIEADREEASAGLESDEEDDYRWTEFSKKIKRLASR